ncbi:MAG: DUF2800 domain-containing protein [Fidelibacterota bacterium]
MRKKSKSKSIEDTTHARCSPSAAKTWVNCPASIEMQKGKENKTSAAAEEGTLAHSIVENMLIQDIRTHKKIEKFMGIKIDTEMFVHCLDYCKYVESQNILDLKVEHKSPLFYSHKETGTVDALGVDKYGTLHIIDLKYGRGVFVEVKDNLQLQIYAISAIEEFQYSLDIKNVKVHIFQPRMGNVSSHEYDLSELFENREKIKRAEKMTWSTKAPINPSEEACKWCKAKYTCSARAKSSLQTIDDDFRDLDKVDTVCLKNPAEMPMDTLVKIARRAKEITSFVKDVQNIVIERIMAGESVRGTSIKPSNPIKKWVDEEKVIKALTKAGFDGIIKPKVPTPLQTISAFKKSEKKIPSKLLNLIEETPGKTNSLVFEE